MKPIKPNQPILYLDFDGVLHHHEVYAKNKTPYMREPGHELFEWVKILDDTLNKVQGLQIVLSTSWVRHLRYDFSVKQLPESIQSLCIGGTWHTHMNYDGGWGMYHGGHSYWDQMTRYQQIQMDVNSRKVTNWIAIDDNIEGWATKDNDKIIVCNPEIGISEHGKKEEILNKIIAMPGISQKNVIKKPVM